VQSKEDANERDKSTRTTYHCEINASVDGGGGGVKVAEKDERGALAIGGGVDCIRNEGMQFNELKGG
jgi:hypothetical protein